MAETVPYRGARNDAPSPPTADDSHRADAHDRTLPAVPGDGNLSESAKVGRYHVLEHVGSGGMGVVYRAHDPELRREVAVKLLKAGRSVGPASAKRRKRLLREARAMAQLSHPNVIPVYDVGEFGDGLYVAMEFVLGSNAREWLKAENPPWRRTLGVFRAAGRGLAAAHTAGLVHRDFKPANVLVGDDGRVRVLDFGLARAAVDGPDSLQDGDIEAVRPQEADLERHWSETLTADGTILGTPIYMAPEQYAGKVADARSDQYSYCLALYEALYRRLPFKGKSVKDVARAKYRGEVREPPRGSPVPPRLFSVLQRGLAPSPEDRFASMPDLLRELRTVQQDDSTPPPPWRAWASVGGVVAATAGLLVTHALVAPAPVPAPPRCPDASALMVDTWDAARREQTRQAFVDSKVAAAEPRWREVADHLDQRVREWSARYEQTCRAALPGPREERLHRAQLDCLARHRGTLAAFVDTLTEPSAVVVYRAPAAAHGLPPLEECDDERALLASADRDAAHRERTMELERSIGRARALRTTGQPEPARAQIDAVIEQAGVEDLRAVTGRALLERAYLHRSVGDLPAAEHDLRTAYFNAVADRRARLAATAAVSLVDVLAALRRPEPALAWSEHARAQLGAIDPATVLDAALKQAIAHVRAVAASEPDPAPSDEPLEAPADDGGRASGP